MLHVIADSFWLALAVKAVLTATIVVGALATAEAAGPFWGGLIASFPISAGPAYVLLALQHDDRFIAASALESFAVNTATWLFLLVLIRLAPRMRAAFVLPAALGAWAVTTAAVTSVPWTAAGAAALNLVVLGACLWFSRGVRMPTGLARPARRWFDLPLRGALVAALVTTVVTLSRVLGPTVTGIGAVFPIAFSSLALLALTRLGGAATAALMANAMRALPGFALALLTLHLMARPLGAFPAMGVALGVNATWALGLLARRYHRPRAARLA